MMYTGRMLNFLKRVLQARPEVQGAMIATVNLMNIFHVWEITEDQLAALNIALVAWFGLAAKVAFERGMEQLQQLD